MFNEMNLLVTVVVLIDDVPVAEVERLIINGMATDIKNNTTRASPPTNKEKQRQFMDNGHAPFLFLEMIDILY